ncbi:hypothetical protein Poli38472_002303 [Pythium oligandrum]|uniref:RING-type domain-containing protein n=1 Tax=Pythium oligandrum TaxID=41045 RepID=A0A8K1FL09_PYTOL|nr:hypothetical protein Poli38472_002303 [Pythium oligandrum]|eukprot:TMW63362.1 hypothetical protein Poli38472_002303 [Pythium oligandrum]
MDLAIRVNVRYAAPPNSQIKDALRLFKSPRWVQSIIRYIMPQLNSVSPVAMQFLDVIKTTKATPRCENTSCVVCMEALGDSCVELPCQHQFHDHCIEPWLKMHSTCPTCRAQLPTDACTSYSVYAINTTIILQQSQARMPTAELLELPASNQIIRAVVNARVRRNVPTGTLPEATSATQSSGQSASTAAMLLPLLQPVVNPVMNASVIQRDVDGVQCITEPVVPILPRNAARRRLREEDMPAMNKRARLGATTHEQDISTST